MISRRVTSTAIATIAASAVLLGLTGCGTPPWLDKGSASSSSPSPTASPTIRTITNDLATGSTKRALTAGSIGLTVNYWSDLAMDKWTAGANKPLSFSLTGALTPDDGQQVYLSKVSAVVAVSDGNKSLPAPAPIADQASITPGYLIKTPYSYSQTFVLPALDPKATSVTLDLTYELLLQSTPTSAQYAKQTATDTIVIAIAR
ncbi:hypothetical protein [Lacisediminihabitans changchengi]|uniref:Uncharacterized protein n=1 Tax=Lacisediminihabitans changchengi TaxID=2787634 RepID=A0A934SHS5_9MICO|nr:hypothetical protein [Lacisediminihabitans changchengi]MBK4346866.1 hypothetical protein [Lacisediminihabitans changchengi]MBK4348011.1 hypothetical protein [Lacisediminihabitans changchengi]